MPETLEIRRKRLRYRSWHRGTKELDLLIGGFAMQALERYGEAQLDQFEAILDSDEHDIYAWLTGKNAVPDEFDNDVMRQLLAHVYADK
mgnify:CR=1 FL=1